jgi:hypothetical protein
MGFSFAAAEKKNFFFLSFLSFSFWVGCWVVDKVLSQVIGGRRWICVQSCSTSVESALCAEGKKKKNNHRLCNLGATGAYLSIALLGQWMSESYRGQNCILVLLESSCGFFGPKR